jgi:hypothetical protein
MQVINPVPRQTKMNLKQLQCLANIVALLRFHELPIGDFVKAKQDRCWLLIPMHGFRGRLETLIMSGAFDNHTLAGCREAVARYSMEITLNRLKAEFDVDYHNPLYGAAPAFMHWWSEVVWNKISGSKTNPRKVMKGLRGRGLLVKEIKKPKKWRKS